MTDGLSLTAFLDPAPAASIPSGVAAPEDAAPRAAVQRGGVAAVVIGRNEGARLRDCLASVIGVAGPVIYVDSGSTDGSPARAQAMGAEVVLLDLDRPFTAARARNAGLAALRARPAPPPEYVQLIDGDCVLRPDWIARARAFLDAHPDVAIACGRRRERFPGTSVYNRICDREWDTPPGEARACGGDALARFAPVVAIGGYRSDLIAGEEPELCVRLRASGWRVWRIDAEMCWHDAAMTRFRQWWRRSRRAGYAFAAGAGLHGAPPERHWVAETRRALLWGAALPALALGGIAAAPSVPAAGFAALLLLAYPAQVARLARRAGSDRDAWEWAAFTVLGKLPEALGVLEYRLTRRARLIEYK
ncbi:MAG: glycosyl transferase [Rhodovulum sulfidophilum]|uniref:Glycosyl transferase n=1 Tax=Rhodovulum sulfidophilum TaxID=35806 RepID=A0A2W5NGB0_RHOSU|nr:MAG: glycosyl transferase [Rhodovulum sulfidophilum]